MKLQFNNLRFSRVFCLRRTCFISVRANDLRGSSCLKTINPSTQTASIFSIKRYKHLANVQEELEDKQKCVNESNFMTLINGDPLTEKKLKILFLEAEVFRQNGERVPDNISLEQWKELLELPTRSKRRKYMAFLFGIEKARENRKKKKEELQLQRKERDLLPKESEDGHILYRLGHNSLFLRVYDATITKYQNNRLIRAMQFGQKLVLDCGYDSYMNKLEAQNCGKQMLLMFSENREHDNPFDLHFCNVNKESMSIKKLAKNIPTLYDPDFPLNLTEKSYLDLFPKENLIYLTPHCREVMKEFDHDAIYIIGAMIDKTNNEPLSLAKAKREGLKMVKLPLDEYLLWGASGSKSLTLNQMISILLDIRETNDWNKSLVHVPRRKIVTPHSGNDFQGKKIDRKQNVKQQMYNFKITDS